MNPSNAPAFAVFVPNSPQRHTFQRMEDMQAFLKSPEGKQSGIRFKRCARPSDINEFFSKHERVEGTNSEDSASSSGDPAVPYPSVPTERLNVLKRVISERTRDDATFDRMLAENPRFVLNTSSDNPTIVQAGFRYNVMHVACQSGNVHVVREIIRHVSDPQWIANAYGTEASSVGKSKYLLDAFLNTPDKSANNTPLHFAAKYCVAKQGAGLDVIAELLQQRACKRNAENNVGKTPLDICLEYKGAGRESFIREVKALFRGKHYVALYRTSDNSVPPVLALSDLELLQTRSFAESEFKALLKISPRSSKQKHASPTVRKLVQEKEERSTATEILANIMNNAKQSTPKRDLYEYVLCAYAGPFDDAEQAEDFYQVPWNSDLCFFNSLLQEWLSTYRRHPKTDLRKGYEAVGRRLAWRKHVGFAESWSFLDTTLVDVNSVEGLHKLNDYLRKVYAELQLEMEVEELGDVVQRRLVFDDSLRLDGEDADEEMNPEEFFEDAKEFQESRRGSEEDYEDDNDFSTAPQSPRDDPVSFRWPTYVLGRVPSKEDEHLFAALDELPRELLDRHPYVAEYARQMQRVPRDERNAWPATDSPRFNRSASRLHGHAHAAPRASPQTTPLRGNFNPDRSRSPLRRILGGSSPSSDDD
ncbi:ankyrin repeat and LEM domain-containing protein 2-like protein [Aphelenchoides avenae]|nr:ankyrin repeat and LEM domain-containing protein 2-like protein [Aphelenchus avenae]